VNKMTLNLQAKQRLLAAPAGQALTPDFVKKATSKLNGANSHKFQIEITKPIQGCIKQVWDMQGKRSLKIVVMKPGLASMGKAYISTPGIAGGMKDVPTPVAKANRMLTTPAPVEHQYFPANPGTKVVNTSDIIWIPLTALETSAKLATTFAPSSDLPKFTPEQTAKAVDKVAAYLKKHTGRDYEFDDIVVIVGEVLGITDPVADLDDEAYDKLQEFCSDKIFSAACKKAGVNPDDYE